MLQYILSFIVLISIVVFIHEYGHYYFAKKYKVGVTDFSIGFGKELFGFNDKDGTRWKICAIPLGGYVKFFGDSNSASQPTSLSKINEDDHSKLLTKKKTKDNFGNNIERKLIGIKIAPLQGKLNKEKMGPAKAFYLSVKETYNTISMTLSYIGRMISGQESADQLGGPIKIAQISGKVAEHGLVPFLSIMAYISISLGLINLFPIPLLDGGHLFFYLIEFIRGKPLSENVQINFYRFGMAILFTLMFFATFNDLKSLGLF